MSHQFTDEQIAGFKAIEARKRFPFDASVSQERLSELRSWNPQAFKWEQKDAPPLSFTPLGLLTPYLWQWQSSIGDLLDIFSFSDERKILAQKVLDFVPKLRHHGVTSITFGGSFFTAKQDAPSDVDFHWPEEQWLDHKPDYGSGLDCGPNSWNYSYLLLRRRTVYLTKDESVQVAVGLIRCHI